MTLVVATVPGVVPVWIPPAGLVSEPSPLPPNTRSTGYVKLGLKLVSPSIIPVEGISPSPEGVILLLQLVMPGPPLMDIPASLHGS